MSSIRIDRHGVNPTILVCALCGEPTNEIALLGVNRGVEAPMYSNAGTLCDTCTERKKEFIALIVVKDEESKKRTGQIIWVKRSAFSNMFDGDHGDVFEKGAALIGPELAAELERLAREAEER